ncbi:nitroreductase (plasmid) [Paraburkholderia sprentiae WSM5005]|uniref:Nitroreductase n=2 Tax=Paraburkholderia sprentiae WSM5005 TaxID=754502 RepID=A0ACA8AX93_9BURK|nr:nitroreductase [Paraburkholderia sprentiae]APA90331.1 nitroreductase [Paraburkholderia sprentiae WSM5005]APA90470.1 nitroreductase [Paraburkholderia sprentiae WSM5005]
MNATPSVSAIEAIVQRRSVRRFLDTLITAGVIDDILNLAARAPSGTNIQPWHVHVVTGNARNRLSAAVLEAAREGRRCDEYAYMPEKLHDVHLSRRRKVGFDLYSLYGIERSDHVSRKEAMLRNFKFFGAPVGLFFTMDRYLLAGSWLDSGMFMQNVMIAAQCYGIASCPQQAWCEYGGVVHDILNIPDSHILLSGMALGYEDTSADENRLRTERAPAREFAIYHNE